MRTEERSKIKQLFRYASKGAHKGTEMSRACDLESWFYVLMEIVNGSLPWSDIKVMDTVDMKNTIFCSGPCRDLREEKGTSKRGISAEQNV